MYDEFDYIIHDVEHGHSSKSVFHILDNLAYRTIPTPMKWTERASSIESVESSLISWWLLNLLTRRLSSQQSLRSLLVRIFVYVVL